MAKLLAPLMSAEARGRLGGLVYNTWRGIRYAKSKTGPAQPRSKLQLMIRSWTIMLARAWQTLNAAQRASWNQYATLHTETDWTGTPVRLTGLNWWIRNNIHSLLAGQLGFVSVPTVPAPPAVTGFAAGDGVGETIVTWDPTTGEPKHLDIWMFGPHSKGVIGSFPRARHKAMANGTTGTETIINLIAGTYTLWARVIHDNTGLASTWVSDTAVIT